MLRNTQSSVLQVTAVKKVQQRHTMQAWCPNEPLLLGPGNDLVDAGPGIREANSGT